MGIMRTMRFLSHPSVVWDNGDTFWLYALKPGGSKLRGSVPEEVSWERPREHLAALEGSGDDAGTVTLCCPISKELFKEARE